MKPQPLTVDLLLSLQREIANSFASNASLVHKQVVRTEEGRKRYADQVGQKGSMNLGVIITVSSYYGILLSFGFFSQRAIEEHIRAKKQKGTLIDKIT